MSIKITYPAKSMLSGDPRLASGSVEFLKTGTLNFRSVYRDQAMTQPVREQIGLNSKGLPTIDLWAEDEDYRVIFRSRTGLIIADGALSDFLEKLDPGHSAATISTRPRSEIWALAGTSLVQHNHTGNSGFKVSSWSKGWWPWVETLLNGAVCSPVWFDPSVRAGWEPSGPGTTVYFRGANTGIGGALLAEMDARITYIIESIRVHGVVYDGGTNDVATQTKEYIFRKRCEHIDRLLRAGLTVVVLPILARSTADWAQGSDRRRKANWVNRMTIDWVRTRRNCYLFDWNQIWVDFNSADGGPKAGFSPDGTHFSTLSAYAVGKQLASFMQALLPPLSTRRVASPDDKYDATHNPLGNKMLNPALKGAAGSIGTGVTGQVADNMRALRNSGVATCAASKEASSTARGDAQVLTITPPGAAGTTLFYFQTAVTSIAHGFPVGAWVEASVEVECGAWNGWQGITMQLRESGAEGVISYGMEDYAGDQWPVEAWSGTIASVPFQIKDGAGTLQWCVRIKTSDLGTGTGVLKFRMVDLRQVQDPRTTLDYRE